MVSTSRILGLPWCLQLAVAIVSQGELVNHSPIRSYDYRPICDNLSPAASLIYYSNALVAVYPSHTARCPIIPFSISSIKQKKRNQFSLPAETLPPSTSNSQYQDQLRPDQTNARAMLRGLFSHAYPPVTSRVLGHAQQPQRFLSFSPRAAAGEKPLPPRLKINDADLTISYLKGSGPGGQKIVILLGIEFGSRGC